MQSSRPGYELSSADIQQAQITDEMLTRVVGGAVANNELTHLALLAAILQKRTRNSARYRITQFSAPAIEFPIGSGDYWVNGAVQILPSNPYRKALVFNFQPNFDPANPAEIGPRYLFDSYNNTYTNLQQQPDILFSMWQAGLNVVSKISLPAFFNRGTNYQLYSAPTNAVTAVFRQDTGPFSNPYTFNYTILEGY